MTDTERLATVRVSIDALRARISRIEEQPFSRAEAEGLLRDHAAQLATEGARVFGLKVQALEAPDDLSSMLRLREVNGSFDLGPLLAVLLGPKAMGAALARLASGLPEGLGGDERRETLASLRGEMLDAELAEEALIRAMLGEGYAIERRPDADVRALLAMPEGSAK